MVLKINKREKRQQKDKRIKLLLTKVCLGLVFLLVGLFCRRFYLFLKDTHLPKEGRLTIGFDSQPLIIASLSDREKTLNFLLIPRETFIRAAGGYGQYRIEVFENLENLEKKPFLLQQSLMTNLALPISGWLGKGLESPVNQEALVLKKWYQKQLWLALKTKNYYRREKAGKGETNLTKTDLIHLWLKSLTIRLPKVKVVLLKEGRGLSQLTFPDGSQFYGVEALETDQITSELFFEPQIKQENLTIGVANATDYPGLATEASRILNNLGGTVVKIGDWPQKLNFCEIRVKKKANQVFTVRKSSSVLNCQVNENDFGSFLTDILVVVGEDFWQKFGYE